MKIIYAKKSSGIDEQGSFQNPEYYLKPEQSAQMVVIYGDYPQIKADYEELGVDVEVRELPETKPLTIDVKVSITPELQAIVDEAKAECEKVVAENNDLKQQVETLKAGLVQGEPMDLSGLVPVEQLDAVAQKLVEAEDKLKQSHGELIVSQNENTVLKAKIAELEAKPKKPTAAEVKAAKASEDAEKVEQPKE